MLDLGVFANGELIESGTFADIETSGVYGYNKDRHTAYDAPANYGILFVENGGYASGGVPISQIFIDSNGRIYTRIKSAWSSYVYTNWKECTTQPLA